MLFIIRPLRRLGCDSAQWMDPPEGNFFPILVFYVNRSYKWTAPIGWNAYFGRPDEDRGFVMNTIGLTGSSRLPWRAIARNTALLVCMTGLTCLVAPKARAGDERIRQRVLRASATLTAPFLCSPAERANGAARPGTVR
jgi:hypothetical protein